MAVNDVMDTSREQDWISLGLAPFFARKMVEIYKNDPTGRSLPDDFMRSAGKWNSPESVEISDIRIPGERGLSSVSAKLYRPVHERRKGSRDALLLWLHGGGFSQGSPLWPEAHAVCAEICDRTGISCLNLDYALSRLDAEEGLFPQALEQVVSAWLWAGDSLSKNELGNLSQEASFFLGGASAGANLAAAACLKINQDRLAGQTRLKSPQGFFSVYGLFCRLASLEGDYENRLAALLPDPLRFTDQDCLTMYRDYCGLDSVVLEKDRGLIIPGQGDLSNFPPAWLIACQWDDLAGMTFAFDRALKAEGIPTHSYQAAGMLHGFFNWYPTPELPESLHALDFLCQGIKESLLKRKEAATTSTQG